MKGLFKKEMDMTHGGLMKKIILVALPLALSGILQLLFNAADLIIVGQFSDTPTSSLAAVGSTTSLTHLIINLAIGLSVGANVVMSQSIGARDEEKANRTLHTAIALSLCCSVVMSAIGFFGARFFLQLMKSDPNVIDKATLYLKIFFLGMPANLLYNFGAAILRAKGDTARPMIFLSLAGVFNVGLNVILVVLGLDVAGVAIATIASQYLSATLLLIVLLKETGVCKFSFKKLRFHKQELIDIVKIGLPSGILNSCFSLSNVIIQSAINSFGDAMMAANAAASNIEGFIYTSMNAVSLSALTFAGQNFGAKKYTRIKKVMLESSLLVVIVWFVMTTLVLAFASKLVWLYNKDEKIIEFAVQRLWYTITFYCLCGMNEVFVSGLRSMNRTIAPVIFSLFCACIFRIIWVFTVCQATGDPVTLYLSYPISWTANLILSIVYFIVVYLKTIRQATKIQTETSQDESPATVE